MRKLSAAVVMTTLIMSASQAGMPAARAGTATHYYLALGDSLAFGYQPNGVKGKGYVDDLWRSMGQQIPGLKLRNVACPGETTGSLISGVKSLCHYAPGSQLRAAVSFLRAHVGQVDFITITIGANDLVARCLDDNGLFRRACAVEMRPRLQARLTNILDALGAAGSGVPIVGMRYYDPFLGFWGLVPGGRALARASLRTFRVMNVGIAAAYSGAGAAVADVAATFRIHDFKDTMVVPGRGPLPLNVALACKWTWFCTPRFAGDPHANNTGYRKIAQTFHQVIQGLL